MVLHSVIHALKLRGQTRLLFFMRALNHQKVDKIHQYKETNGYCKYHNDAAEFKNGIGHDDIFGMLRVGIDFDVTAF